MKKLKNKLNLSYSDEYRTLYRIKYRCYNKKSQSYKYYGGRGIKVCDRWLESFENFLKDMGKRPKDKSSIDRINNNGNYEPSNCRWATPKEQGRNKRGNRLIIYKGKTKCLTVWAKIIGISPSTIYYWINKGLSFREIVKRFDKDTIRTT